MPPTVARCAARLAVIAALMSPSAVQAQAQKPDSQPAPVIKADSQPAPKPKSWTDRILVRGYIQVRYNQLFQTNPNLVCVQCDPGLGGDPKFTLRRARLIVEGKPVDRVDTKMEVDLTQAVGSSVFILQLRDLFGDVSIDKQKNGFVRIGLAKIPFGYENLQSSAVRIPFDRDDALNSGAPGERDLGAWFIWAPAKIHRELKMLIDSSFKGAQDYGIISFGVYNGQGANRPELNGNKHVVARLAYPFALGHDQVLFAAVQGYTGIFVIPPENRTPGVGGANNFRDERVALSALLVPRPFGLQAEWNWGKGPEYDNVLNDITEQNLTGGYVMAFYRTFIKKKLIYPYVRAQYYSGGKKYELDARSYLVKEIEFGAEILPLKAFEFTAAYMISNRTQDDGIHPNNPQKGQTLRLQAQFVF